VTEGVPRIGPPSDAPQPPQTAKIIPFRGVTSLDLPPEAILQSLREEGHLEGFVYVGYDKAGSIICGSTYADGGTVLWLIETLRLRLMGALPHGDDA
jgi:hypothetical protein